MFALCHLSLRLARLDPQLAGACQPRASTSEPRTVLPALYVPAAERRERGPITGSRPNPFSADQFQPANPSRQSYGLPAFWKSAIQRQRPGLNDISRRALEQLLFGCVCVAHPRHRSQLSPRSSRVELLRLLQVLPTKPALAPTRAHRPPSDREDPSRPPGDRHQPSILPRAKTFGLLSPPSSACHRCLPPEREPPEALPRRRRSRAVRSRPHRSSLLESPSPEDPFGPPGSPLQKGLDRRPVPILVHGTATALETDNRFSDNEPLSLFTRLEPPTPT